MARERRASVQEVIASRDPERVRQKLNELLQDVGDGMGSPITIYCAQLCQAELERQAVEKLEGSSRRLETLTRVLIVMTGVLIVLAAPPAVELIGRLFGR
jgi:CHASE3 domain sensor protein